MRWIKHDTNANQDAKLQNVLLDYGLEGYGLYWYCIELIAGKVDKENITFELEHDARIIARNTGSTAQKVEEMMKYFVTEGLFENTEGMVTCLKLAKRLDKSMTSNPEMRDIIASLKSHDGVMIGSAKPMQDKIRLEETRVDKNKDINTHGSSIDKPSAKKVDEDFEHAWSQYPKREGANPKNKALSAWNARRKEGVEADVMINGVFKYMQFCATKGQVNTSYVMQGSRFFGKELNFNNDWSVNHEQNQRPSTQRPMSAVERVTAANRESNQFEQKRYPGSLDIDGEFVRT